MIPRSVAQGAQCHYPVHEQGADQGLLLADGWFGVHWVQDPGGHQEDAPHGGGGALHGEPQQVQGGLWDQKSQVQVTYFVDSDFESVELLCLMKFWNFESVELFCLMK